VGEAVGNGGGGGGSFLNKQLEGAVLDFCKKWYTDQIPK